MNLHGIVSGAISTVNPVIVGTIAASTGYTTINYVQTPSYATPLPCYMQVQALTSRDLQQISALNIQGNLRKVWLNGQWNGINRPAAKGGDLLVFCGLNWKVFQVIEQWQNWSSLYVVQTE